ncbi:hypothetical protein TRICI_002777 [Trichomonascus ciferrii]|uniref:BHLH domain-containing protein n=1 Tax=Trichomonascus ciferrii TaxID=44093 RepID=A0A642V5U1_9ASCO|nr:hypothetical protein TRICI_002777 [Trichomonascus ciferrii]
MQVNPASANRRGFEGGDASPRKKMKTGAEKEGNSAPQEGGTDPLLSGNAQNTGNSSNEFESVASDAVKVAAAAAAAAVSDKGAATPTTTTGNSHPHHHPATTHGADDGVIDNELLKEKAAAAGAAGHNAATSALSHHDHNTFQQILLNHDLPHTNQVLQQRMNSPLAREFRNQFSASEAAQATAGGEASHDHSAGMTSPPDSGSKPGVGSNEWHKLRKDNHKEVERRRRENINKGIERIAELLPECEKQKSLILQRAYEYIKKLKSQEASNMEKFALEKLLTEQAIAELTTSNGRLRGEIEKAWRDIEHWKHVCLRHGIDIEKEAPPERDEPANTSATTSSTGNTDKPNNNEASISNADSTTSNNNNDGSNKG